MKGRQLSAAQARAIYKKIDKDWEAAHGRDYTREPWPSIVEEMQAIVAAPSEHKAANVIRWWDIWPCPRFRSAAATAMFIRAEAAKIRSKP